MSGTCVAAREESVRRVGKQPQRRPHEAILQLFSVHSFGLLARKTPPKRAYLSEEGHINKCLGREG